MRSESYRTHSKPWHITCILSYLLLSKQKASKVLSQLDIPVNKLPLETQVSQYTSLESDLSYWNHNPEQICHPITISHKTRKNPRNHLEKYACLLLRKQTLMLVKELRVTFKVSSSEAPNLKEDPQIYEFASYKQLNRIEIDLDQH